MAKTHQPFMGMKLSDLKSTGGPSLDQKLYGPVPASAKESPTSLRQSSGVPMQETKVASNQATKTKTKQPSNRATVQPSSQDAMVETVRLGVKELGHVAGTHRYTAEEKHALEELVYEYRRKGIQTSGNEIIRIGLNFLLEDYRLNGRRSILARVLERLNA